MITVMKWVQNGILNGRREKNQENKKKILILSFFLKGRRKEYIEKVNLLLNFGTFS